MSEHDILYKLLSEVGEIKGTVKGIEDHVRTQNGIIAELLKKVQRHEVIFGKIGIAATAFLFVSSFIVNAIMDFIRDKFFRG